MLYNHPPFFNPAYASNPIDMMINNCELLEVDINAYDDIEVGDDVSLSVVHNPSDGAVDANWLVFDAVNKQLDF